MRCIDFSAAVLTASGGMFFRQTVESRVEMMEAGDYDPYIELGPEAESKDGS